MSGSERDLSILRHILSYCAQIDEAVERFGADGELGSDIRKMQHVMRFAEPDSLRRYRLTALRPAVAEEIDGTYSLVQPGELKLG